MGLRIKILSGFLILAVMLLIAGLWSIYEMNSVGTSVRRLLDDNYTSINAAGKMAEALERQDSATLLLLLGKWERGRTILATADSTFAEAFRTARQKTTIPGETTHLDSVASTYSAYQRLLQRPIVGTVKQGDLDWYFDEVHTSFLKVKGAVNELMLLNEQLIYQTASQLQNRANRAVMPGIVAILAALFFTLVFNYFVNYYAVSPIVRITKGVKTFVERRLPFAVAIETKDELSDLASAIKTLSELVQTPEGEQ